ncbi:MAG: hypothetical protein AAF768_04995 [Pseudomonadota bacterium]
MSRPPKRCVYCGATGVNAEHIWGQWSRKTDYYQLQKKHRQAIQHKLHKYSSNVDLTKPDRTYDGAGARNGDPRSLSLKITCSSCNHGWMRDILEAAKPLLCRLEAGEFWQFNENDKATLAKWVTMFVMSYEFLDKKTVQISQEERSKFASDRKLLPYWSIFCAEYMDDEYNTSAHHKALKLFHAADDTGQGSTAIQVTTLNFGRCLFHCVSSTQHIEDDVNKYAKRLNLVPLHPTHNECELPSLSHALEKKDFGLLQNALVKPDLVDEHILSKIKGSVGIFTL